MDASKAHGTHRGWTIYRGRWPEPDWYAIGPNYDASYEGPEDGWVDNGEKADAPTREALISEIDDWFAEHSPAPLTDEQIKYMTDRFLMWKLPETFRPDAGISFNPEYNVEWNAKQGKPPNRHDPIGTNLFDAREAEAMVRHMVDGMPES